MSRSTNPWNCMQSYRCMQFSWQRSQNFHSTAKCCCGPQTLILTTLEKFLCSTFGPSGLSFIYTFLGTQIILFPNLFSSTLKIRNFSESKWNVIVLCAQSLTLDYLWRQKKSLNSYMGGAKRLFILPSTPWWKQVIWYAYFFKNPHHYF